MVKIFGLVARVLLALIFFITVLLILNNIVTTPNGYSFYQDMLGAKGLPGIFAPISILIQFVFGLALILGYKIKISAYVLAGYSLVWAVIYFTNINLLMSLQYLAITGGLLHLGTQPNTWMSLDNICASRKKK
ncbi:MAG: DoxX family protein [Methylophilales bacterium]|jgi:putative oxidoreductase|nr:DoxX family protein [Pseudomonadota bacterium]NQW34591.1 DoxX family protein [Methylophilales bacterium]|tara:strand:+ start:19149 stop:19547 length:399 start_codon:yes stop_codon:yes gene_type:complete